MTTTSFPHQARYIAANHELTDAQRHWQLIHDRILRGEINPAGAEVLVNQADKEYTELLTRIQMTNRMVTAIYVDHVNKRHWILDADDILAYFPFGDTAQRDATIYLLRSQDPDALELALRAEQRHPKLNGRALRAAEIVANNFVSPHNGAYKVRSAIRTPEYTVTATRCRCIDFNRGEQDAPKAAPKIDGTPACKHLIAAKIYERTR